MTFVCHIIKQVLLWYGIQLFTEIFNTHFISFVIGNIRNIYILLI